MESTESDSPPRDFMQEEQMARMEALLESVHQRIETESLQRRGWWLFWYLVGAHAVVSSIWLPWEDTLNGLLLYGWLVGAASTLSIWHGLSLRPFFQRWHRTLLANVGFCVALSFFSEDVELVSLAEAFLVYCILFSGACICAVTLIRTWLRCGLSAPDPPRVAPNGLRLASFFYLATASALLLTICRFIAWWLTNNGGSSLEPESLTPLAIYGAGVGMILAIAFLAWQRYRTVAGRILLAVGMFGSCVLFNCAMLNVWFAISGDVPGIWDWNDFVKTVPYCVGFTLSQLISPVLTAIALQMNGHRITRV